MKNKKWKKLNPVKNPYQSGCLNCRYPITVKAKMNTKIIVGFGFAGIKKGKDIIYFNNEENWGKTPTLQKFENMARKDPDNDWRMVLHGPMHGETYQRQGNNEWILVESNRGFV